MIGPDRMRTCSKRELRLSEVLPLFSVTQLSLTSLISDIRSMIKCVFNSSKGKTKFDLLENRDPDIKALPTLGL